ncbi:metalloregulator ArsR/SmtB family transcription factor [Heliobacterium gestii]|uniref:Metalloregulator ArsR/SmtB family transcription factor n=1 Tax=Heliomicrobium gestii TaxID=2699 RepID=A0A845LFJ2_HELGE|nr:metalloregulator ArsR/SmtB family transcription factor [Heliomicrobium gestii]MBM7867781.1 ArsR family transcriptional regulator [Heliomicrobium gestii]MZP44174.1 metalloregulator ArsR/SmtB family transcription factor [Heliomicrobium gestii]
MTVDERVLAAGDRCDEVCVHADVVDKRREQLLPLDTYQDLAQLFKALGDPSRSRVLHALSFGELCVCDLASLLEISQSAVSHQLRLLRGLRLVKYRKDGKMVYYSLDDEHVRGLLRQGLEHVSHR